MMALPLRASNQKLACLPLKNADLGVVRQVRAISVAEQLRPLPHRQFESRSEMKGANAKSLAWNPWRVTSIRAHSPAVPG